MFYNVLLFLLHSSGFDVCFPSQCIWLCIVLDGILDKSYKATQLYVCYLRQAHNIDIDICCAAVLFFLSTWYPVLYTACMNTVQIVRLEDKIHLERRKNEMYSLYGIADLQDFCVCGFSALIRWLTFGH